MGGTQPILPAPRSAATRAETEIAIQEATRLNAKGVSAAASGRMREALTSFEAAFRLDSSNAEIAFNLGRAREDAEQVAAAIDAFEQYVILAPSAKDVAAVEQKIAALRSLRIPVPEEAKRHALAGQRFLRVGQVAEAEREFKLAEALAPEWPAIQFNLGTLYQDQGRAAEAALHFRRYLPFAVGDELGALRSKLVAFDARAAAEKRAADEVRRVADEAEQLAAQAKAKGYQISGETVLDTRTRLTWQRGVASHQLNWKAADAYCVSLSLAGAGWRLPITRELMGLVDKSAGTPAIYSAAFPNTPGSYYWTAEVLGGFISKGAYLVDFSGRTFAAKPDELKPAHEDERHLVRCVR